MKKLILISILLFGCSKDERLADQIKNDYSASSIQKRADAEELRFILNYIEMNMTDRRVLISIHFQSTHEWLNKNGYKVESAFPNTNLFYIRW